MPKLTREFYNRDTLDVARDLLGKYLVRRLDGMVLCGRIVETEAYVGRIDKACHAYGYKRTRRTETLFAQPGTAPEAGSVTVVTHAAQISMPLAELVDLDAERKRLSKELEKKKKYQSGIEKKLSNEKFLAKAPEDVVQREKDNLAKAQREIEQLESSLAALG